MKKVVLALAVVLSSVVGVQAAETGGMKMDGMQMAPGKTANRTTGVIKALDAKGGTVTLSHEAVPALKWPAMTMAFKISPELAKGLQVGQKVEFEFVAKDMDGTITKIGPVK
jgi:Cu(I)/Ag(I) efflux system protein CusF